MANMDSIGARLKNLRLEKGISLEDVHKKTKIHLNILKAIEENNFINLNQVYLKGFIKIYCKFLGIDPKEYISDYKEPITRPAAEKPAPNFAVNVQPLRKPAGQVPFKLAHIKKAATVIIILIFSIGLFNVGKNFLAKQRALPKKAKDSLQTSAKIKKKTQEPKEKKPKTQKTQPQKQKPQVQKTQTQKPQAQEAQAKTAKAQKPKYPTDIRWGSSAKDSSAEASTIGVRLGIHTKEDCYIQLKTDGKTIFQGILKKGMSESWQAKNKIELSLGNAGAVDIEINGKIISELGRKGQALKNILITPGGLSVGQ